ncbi:hypothetical protein PAXINDRAFT_157760 [Paxillus involutus ATCC 200175]|uniref:Uncharacterized protein n=1 Tax=Paxillus involutus ATCC 200175 TaxID=664439 RepID=A0A0C9TQA0_PAXIN|nr:hypothetical protein PAXINDRAFT_157760 [Paxillus involutus ATCC 200175]
MTKDQRVLGIGQVTGDVTLHNERLEFKFMAQIVNAVTYTSATCFLRPLLTGNLSSTRSLLPLSLAIALFLRLTLAMVTTRKENATKCVAQPLLDSKRKHRTKAEIEANKQCLVEECQKAKEERQAGNERIASIQNRQALEDIKAKIGAKPRPQPRQVRPASKGQPSMHLNQTDGNPTNDSMEANISAGVPAIVDVGGKGEEELRPRKEPRKMLHHDAVNALRQEAQASSGLDTCGSGKIINNHQADDSKGTFLGHMNQWISDVAKSGKPKWLSQRITSSSNTASSTRISSFSHPTAATSKTTASSLAFKPPPSCLPTPLSVEDEPPAVLLDDDDTIKREAAHSLMNLHKSPAVDWQIPQSKDKDIDYGQPPFTQEPTIAPVFVKAEPVDIPVDVTNDFSDSDDDPIIIDAPPVARSSMLTGQKRTTTIVQATDHSNTPSSKCSRTNPPSVHDRTGGECSTRKVKYNNSHLPQGAMTDNKWCGTLIPMYAKWNGTLNICWGTKSSFEVKVLQLLWDVIYKHKIPASVQSDDPIHTVDVTGDSVKVKRTLILLRDNALTFEVIPPSGKGKKRVTRSEKWKVNITGEMFKKDFWDHETVHFMQSIEGIPPKVWDEIIDTTLQFVKETMRKPGRGVLSNDEDNTRALSDDDGDEFTDLMTYR